MFNVWSVNGHAKVLSVLNNSCHLPAFCSTDWFVTLPDILSLLLIYILLFQGKRACLLHLNSAKIESTCVALSVTSSGWLIEELKLKGCSPRLKASRQAVMVSTLCGCCSGSEFSIQSHRQADKLLTTGSWSQPGAEAKALQRWTRMCLGSQKTS